MGHFHFHYIIYDSRRRQAHATQLQKSTRRMMTPGSRHTAAKSTQLLLLGRWVNFLVYIISDKTRSTRRAQTSLAEADHYSHISQCNLLSLGGERLRKANPKGFGSLPAPRSGYATTIMVFFAHLLLLEYPDHRQNSISSSLYHPGPLHKISFQSIQNVLSNGVHRQADKQANRQTNATKTLTSFAKEVINI